MENLAKGDNLLLKANNHQLRILHLKKKSATVCITDSEECGADRIEFDMSLDFLLEGLESGILTKV